MREEKPGIEIPEGWKVETYRFSGNFRLIADFINEKTDAKVKIRPHKSYSDLPGFPDCHSAVLIHPEGNVEKIALETDLEYVEDAEQAALKKMEELNGSR